jgi:hypothetical protein
MTVEATIKVGYGLDIHTTDDPYIEVAEKGIHTLLEALVPGAYLVDIMPSLKYIPKWFPGASFLRKAEEWRKYSEFIRNMPFERATKNLVSHLTFCVNKPVVDDEIQRITRPIYPWSLKVSKIAKI